MSIRFNNHAKKIYIPTVSRSSYKWRVFVDEKDEKVLDKIEYVEYLLPPCISSS
jgi:hypothetical protein